MRITREQYWAWLRLIASGRFKHCRHVFRRRDDQRCGLGLLAEVVNPNAWRWDQNTQSWLWSGGRGMRQFPGRLRSVEIGPMELLPRSIAQQCVDINDRGAGDKYDDVFGFLWRLGPILHERGGFDKTLPTWAMIECVEQAMT